MLLAFVYAVIRQWKAELLNRVVRLLTINQSLGCIYKKVNYFYSQKPGERFAYNEKSFQKLLTSLNKKEKDNYGQFHTF